MFGMHLWEVKHSYYCNDTNWYSNDCTHHCDSWPEFARDWGNLDDDYNLVFRWDWKAEIDDDERMTERGKTGHGILQVCYMQQRKGKYVTVFVKVTGDDEQAVREWLAPKMRHLMSLWTPIVAAATPT